MKGKAEKKETLQYVVEMQFMNNLGEINEVHVIAGFNSWERALAYLELCRKEEGSDWITFSAHTKY